MTYDEAKALYANQPEKRKHSDPEFQLQVSCVEYFKIKYPKTIIHHSPNGELRKKSIAAKLKRGGVVPGIPDLQIFKANHGYNGFFVELKNGNKGQLSEHQKKVIENLEENGYKVSVVRNIDEFIKEVDEYMK